MFAKILVANRGEIACRIVRTCRRLGIATVAVHSSADRNALHVAMADEAVRIGAAPSSESYLDVGRIVRAAIETGAEAIHPGYGFLSENPALADACAEAGIVFVGPPAAAIRAMGSKAEAKRIVRAAGVPLMAGDPDAAQDDASLAAAADAAGYPVIVKPAMGGGGRGMRVVRAPSDLAPALAAARREAQAAFADSALLIERLMEPARHIEVQVFADTHGNVVHLFERDCSVQRRHQKVIEEAPAPGLDPAVRNALCTAAVRAAAAVGYVGAGTVEFLLGPDGDFRFMEMNTRLQVEHPVTEAVTGLDLVEWQLRVAAGERLPLTQTEIRCSGHAIEARLYAEDPANEFAPGVGTLARLRLPSGEGIRVDAGVREGDAVTQFYDPMIAKIVAAGPDRGAACARLAAALSAVEVAGPATNERFLAAICTHPEFAAGAVDTGFVARRIADLAPVPAPPPDGVLALAALAEMTRPGPADPSPWGDPQGWRMGGAGGRAIRLRSGDAVATFRLDASGALMRDGAPVDAAGRWTADGRFRGVVAGRAVDAVAVRTGATLTAFVDGMRHVLTVDDPLAAGAGTGLDAASLLARMPGTVVAVHVAEGDRVKAGTPLIAVEAMKVEHTVRAPADGIVTRMNFKVGDRVSEGTELAGFEPD
jgi:3-methylcrotonyl-CoA carboxylase alpha subunit